MPLWTIAGQRANSIIHHKGDGFFYHVQNVKPNSRFPFLRCIFYGNRQYLCPGTAKVLLEGDDLISLRRHSHGADMHCPTVLSLKRNVYDRVKAGDQTPFNEILQQEGQRYSFVVRARVPLGTILSRLNALRSARRPLVPPTLEALGICLLQPEYQYLTRCLHVPETLFAGMCGTLADQTLSLVFISAEMKDFMQTRSMVFADGTGRFLFRKPKASQIYVIAAAWRFHAIVMCRALMLRRTQTAYEVLLQYLLGLMPNFSPVKCDFEDAQMNAWRSMFPQSQVEGCLWHYNVAVYSMARKKLGLYQLIKEEEEVASIIRAAGALPLLPSHEIESGLQDLGEEAVRRGWMRDLRYFFRYMYRQWIPKAPVLSVGGSVHQTNNICESSNRSFNKAVRVTNPSVFDVLRALVVTNEKYTVDLHTLALNLQPGRGRKISALRNDARIRRLTTDYENGDISRLDFLHKASRKFQNVFDRVFS